MPAMPTTPRAWIKALIVCCAVGLTALVLMSTVPPAHAEPAVRARVAVAAAGPAPTPSTTPARPPSTGGPGSPASATPLAPQPTSAPTRTPGPAAGSGAASGGCGLFDVSCKLNEAINGFFRGIVTHALNPVFRLLARSVLSSPRIDQMDRVQRLWTTSAWIANTCFVLLVVIAGLLIMSHQSLQTSYALKDVGPRLVVAMVAANVNLPLIGQAITFANGLSRAFMGHGVDPGQAAGTIKGLIVRALTDATDVFSSILSLVAVLAGLAVLFTFALRIMLLVLLTAAAPLALACHALPQTEGLARLWWRALAGVLAIQVAQALVFATAMRVFFTSDQMDLFGIRSHKGLFDLVLVICLLYILARIPSWTSKMIFRGGAGRSPILRAARTIAAILIFRNLGAAAAGRRGGPPRRPPTPPPPPPAPTIPVTPVVPPPPAPPSWTQPQLPFPPPRPPATGTQLQLPINPPPPGTPRPAATQLRLPGVPARPPRWQQTALPIRPRYTQTRLPAPPAHVQPELPLAFPPPGSPPAGRSARRLADTAALRDAEARARRRTTPNPNPSSSNPRRNP